MKKELIFVISLLAACLFPITSCKQQKTDRDIPLKLLYWNIQNGMWDGQGDNYDRFVDFVKAQDPDICVWCEAESIYKTGSDCEMPVKDRYLVNGWGSLAKRYGHDYWGIGGHRDSYPQVITSKYPISYVKKIIGAEPDSVVTHGAGWAQIKIGSANLNIVTLHTWPLAHAFGAADIEASAAAREGDHYRTKEMKYICEHTIGTDRQASQNLWVMLGDFNSISVKDIDHYKYDRSDSRFLVHDYILGNTPYLDVIKEMHPSEFKPTGSRNTRIDFVYCTKAFYDKVVSADIIKDSYTTQVRDPEKLSNFWHPSDHLPIVIEFNLE